MLTLAHSLACHDHHRGTEDTESEKYTKVFSSSFFPCHDHHRGTEDTESEKYTKVFSSSFFPCHDHHRGTEDTEGVIRSFAAPFAYSLMPFVHWRILHDVTA
jgi:hypothetical protein